MNREGEKGEEVRRKQGKPKYFVSVHKVGYFAARHCICIRKCVF
jgi:hypothetical protein